MYNGDGLVIRMLWGFCVSRAARWDDLNVTSNDFPNSANSFKYRDTLSTAEFFASSAVKYRSASYLRHDLPLAVENGNHYCPTHYRFGIALNPATVKRGCSRWRDMARAAWNASTRVEEKSPLSTRVERQPPLSSVEIRHVGDGPR